MDFTPFKSYSLERAMSLSEKINECIQYITIGNGDVAFSPLFSKERTNVCLGAFDVSFNDKRNGDFIDDNESMNSYFSCCLKNDKYVLIPFQDMLQDMCRTINKIKNLIHDIDKLDFSNSFNIYSQVFEGDSSNYLEIKVLVKFHKDASKEDILYSLNALSDNINRCLEITKGDD